MPGSKCREAVRRTEGCRFGRRFGTAAWVGLAALAVLVRGAIPGHGAAPMTLAFESYGAYFSKDTHQRIAIDPQVFIKAPGAAAEVGPQSIAHAAGVTPAPIEDPASTPLYSSDGRPLKITLGQWLGASGTATITAAGGGREQLATTFKGLVARGSYSLFEMTSKSSKTTLAPLDGAGTANNLIATDRGTGTLTVAIPAGFSHTGALLLVYHSDGQTHSMLPGALGLTAHYQLIAGVP